MTATVIIAEAGVNHNGDLTTAQRMVDVAAEVGADVFKCQTFSADRLVTRDATMAQYQQRNTGAEESQHAMLSKLELSRSMHEALIEQCQTRRIGFLSAPFDIDSVDLLVGLGQKRFKIPSGEITNLPYLRHLGRLGHPLILSTGMATLGEIEAAVEVIEAAGTSREKLTVLHCTTDYPAAVEDVNLRAMVTIRDALGVAVGYSDHTLGIEVPIAAVALGAAVIEKHFTLDRNLPGPDHRASLEADEFRAMVVAIRNIEKALGDGIKRPVASEGLNKPIARKSLVAARAIAAGELFSAANVTAKRPGTGISPMSWDEIVGRKAPRPFDTDELIELF